MQFGACRARIVAKCFVVAANSKQHFNGPTFAFLADTKLHMHSVFSQYLVVSTSTHFSSK